LGTASERLRYTNGTDIRLWDVNIAATDPTDVWDDGGSNTYDFNDPGGSGCTDSGDGDGDGGQLTVDPSGATRAALSGCTIAGLTRGASDAFEEGVTDDIDLLTADGSSELNCIWDLTDVSFSQKIPAEQSVATYNLDMTITIAAL